MAASDVSLCSEALLLLGEEPITDFAGEGAPSVLCANLYTPALEFLLVSYPWRFSIILDTLQQLEEPPPHEYAVQYNTPNGTLSVIEIGKYAEPWEMFGGKILTDYDASVAGADALPGTFQVRPKPEFFPAHFQEALRTHLAWRLCIPIKESVKQAEHFYEIHRMANAAARNIDSRQRPTQTIVSNKRRGNRFPLTAVRG